MEGVIGLIWRYWKNDYQINLMELTPKEQEAIDKILQDHENDMSGIRGDANLTIESANIAFWEEKWSAKARVEQRKKLAEHIYDVCVIKTDVFYDDREDSTPTLEEIEEDLKTFSGSAYTMEAVFQNCIRDDNEEWFNMFHDLSMEIIHYMEGFNNE